MPLTLPAVSLAVWPVYCLASPAVDELALEAPVAYLPGRDIVEHGCWQQFFDSSMDVLAKVNKKLVEVHQLAVFDVLLLDILAKSDRGAARVSELADALGSIRSRAAAQVRYLETQGLVTRSPGPEDRRGVLPRITWEGRAQVAEALATYAREIRTHYLDRLSPEQMIALGDSCCQVKAPINAAGRTAQFRRV